MGFGTSSSKDSTKVCYYSEFCGRVGQQLQHLCHPTPFETVHDLYRVQRGEMFAHAMIHRQRRKGLTGGGYELRLRVKAPFL